MAAVDFRKGIGYIVAVGALHIAGFAALASVAATTPAFWAIGLLAYSLGLRHAFDADHIAAIDNTVRKLVQQKQNPLGVGFYFSLGHSTIVFLLALGVALAAQAIQSGLPHMQEIGSVIGMTVSGTFLVIMGILNLVVLINLYKVFGKLRDGKTPKEELDTMVESGGVFTRLTKPLFRFVNKSWQIYPIGFLFGLGFDTATEIGLLALSAGAAQSSISFVGVLSLPLLFAAGMTLMDTADSWFMAGAYRWAFATPLRKVYYNVTVTTVSVIVALMIGAVELSQVAVEQFKLAGGFAEWVAAIDFGDLGFVLVGVFALAWVASFAVWKFVKFEKAQ